MNYTIAVFSFNRHQNLLPYTLRSIKQNMSDYEEIVIVWDDYLREKPVDFNKIKKITNVDFRVIKHTEIYNWPTKISEWGWIRQQLAKILCYTYIPGDRTYIVDSDVIFLKNPKLFSEDKIFLRYDNNCSVPEEYKFFMQQYLDISQFNDKTYVGSTCLFEHDILKKIQTLCEKKNNKNIIECVDDMLTTGKHDDLPFSEFEIYGHVVKSMFPDRCILAERNWNYFTKNTSNKNYNDIIIMWAGDKDQNLESKYKLLQG